MARDGEASRRRLLDAAAAEFAEHGIAGARVDRVAEAAQVNKAQMYGWFGSKDGLFDAVVADQLSGVIDAVPLDADDLPGFAVALYDAYLAAPELLRLTTWHRLERTPVGEIVPGHHQLAAPRYEAIARAQERGRVVAGVRPQEVYDLLVALAGTWSPASATVAASAADPAADHQRRREALRAVVQRALVT